MTHQEFIKKYKITDYTISNNILYINYLDLSNNQLKEFVLPENCEINYLDLYNNQLKEFVLPENCEINYLNLFPGEINFVNHLDIANKILSNKLEAKDVFNIFGNVEVKRIAYKYLDKTKLLKLKNYKILDERIDNYKNLMRLLQFDLDNNQFRFLECICPSTNRKYLIETKYKTCLKAKLGSFNLNSNVKFNKEG